MIAPHPNPMPDPAERGYRQGKALFDAGQFTSAVQAFQHVIALAPARPDAWHMLGSALFTLGDMAGAKDAYQRALSLAPESGATHRHLSNIITYREGHDHFRLMQETEKRADLSLEHREELHYALGKAFHDLKRYDEAFRHYASGAALHRSVHGAYDTNDDAREFDAMRNTFRSVLQSADLSSGCPDDAPIFILGMPRSGTTLVEQILSSHPDAFGLGETPFLFETLARAGTTVNGRTTFRFSELTPEIRRSLGEHYVRRLREHAPGHAKRLSDKMPGNFRIAGFIPFILPNARIIHCTRSPMDTCLSIFRTYFTPPHPYAFDFSALGTYYRLYRELMEFWNEIIPGRIYELRYETLLDDFEPQVRALLEFCGLPWSDNCLQFHQTKRSVSTASAAQVRAPLYRTSMAAWKHYEPYLGPLKVALGAYAEEDA